MQRGRSRRVLGPLHAVTDARNCLMEQKITIGGSVVTISSFFISENRRWNRTLPLGHGQPTKGLLIKILSKIRNGFSSPPLVASEPGMRLQPINKNENRNGRSCECNKVDSFQRRTLAIRSGTKEPKSSDRFFCLDNQKIPFFISHSFRCRADRFNSYRNASHNGFSAIFSIFLRLPARALSRNSQERWTRTLFFRLLSYAWIESELIVARISFQFAFDVICCGQCRLFGTFVADAPERD